VTWVVLIASRDGFFNPLKPNSQDYHNTPLLNTTGKYKYTFVQLLNKALHTVGEMTVFAPD
jgi:hypothetical protein